MMLAALVGSMALSGPLSGSQGEVVGSTGRVGSFVLRSGCGRLAATPRGLAPGYLSPPGTPIYVTTPAAALSEVLAATPADRLADLVLLSNGNVLEQARDALGAAAAASLTAGVLYFAVLNIGGNATSGPGAPLTKVAGPHAMAVANLLQQANVRCEVLDNQASLEKASALKMIWSSALWLLCAAKGCTVGGVTGVHQEHEPTLRGLVNELYREYEELLDGYADMEAVMKHLRAYSESIPHAVPSKVLALDEFSERNGWFLRTSLAAGRQQPLHERMLTQCGIDPNSLAPGSEAPEKTSNNRILSSS